LVLLVLEKLFLNRLLLVGFEYLQLLLLFLILVHHYSQLLVLPCLFLSNLLILFFFLQPELLFLFLLKLVFDCFNLLFLALGQVLLEIISVLFEPQLHCLELLSMLLLNSLINLLLLFLYLLYLLFLGERLDFQFSFGFSPLLFLFLHDPLLFFLLFLD